MNYRGGCVNCGGICGGAKSPRQLMMQVLRHAEAGNITGGEVAYLISQYTGQGMNGGGFFGDLWSGLKKGLEVVKPALTLASTVVPQLRPVAMVANTLGNGRRRKVVRHRRM